MGGENVDALKTRTEDKKNISKGREKKQKMFTAVAKTGVL